MKSALLVRQLGSPRLVLVLSLGLLVADGAGLVAPAAAAPAAATADAQAREAFIRGEQLFKSQRYAEAVAAFEEGNRQKPSSAFLFDLALTYRAMGQPARAIDYYRQYLKAKPDADDRAAVEASIVEEQAKLAKAAPAATPAPAPTVAPDAVAVSAVTADKEAGPPPEKSDRPVYKKWWFWTATGVAVSAVAIGLGVGLSQSGKDPYQEVIWR